MWLLGRLAPDRKSLANFRKGNGVALRQVCARSVALCRTMGLLNGGAVVIDGCKFKAVNDSTGISYMRRWRAPDSDIARNFRQTSDEIAAKAEH